MNAAAGITNRQQQHQPSSAPGSSVSSSTSSPWIRKPLSVVYQQESFHERAAAPSTSNENDEEFTGGLHRHLSLWDLIGIGVGGTVGSGIFVLTGQIAAQNAGPMTFVSFAIAGLAASCSGVCYAELSGRIPAAGSTYVYAYVCLGELAAVVAASCLTLEYGIAGAAVARSWGDKVILWMDGTFAPTINVDWMKPLGGMVNLPACLVSMVSTGLLLMGVQESKNITNFFTALKMLLVAGMTIGGFMLFQRPNLHPWVPYGWQGVLRGSTSSFFGYLGYDEVCCVAGEAIDPARNMPRAVLGTIAIVSVFYVLAAFALTGMLPYNQISPTSGFPDAFATRGVMWAAQLTAIGEVICLPVVVLVSLLAQPRLTLSMAQDGLMPSIFLKVDSTGNLYGGTLLCGLGMTLIATFVPFTYLDDLVSAGILFAFSMTNSCLILLRCESPPSTYSNRPGRYLETILIAFNLACFVTAILWSHDFSMVLPWQTMWALLSTCFTLLSFGILLKQCPLSKHFGGSILAPSSSTHLDPALHFETPLVPHLPCLGMAINWYLIAQLEASGILLLVLYVGITILWYSWGCAHHSVGHRFNWSRRHVYEALESDEDLNRTTLSLQPMAHQQHAHFAHHGYTTDSSPSTSPAIRSRSNSLT